jgi:NTP pyrophosphatase (non-canonical NTP hydrolase)
MNIREYQLMAAQTDQVPGTDEEAKMIPLAGLATETGELLGEYKKYLRDGASHRLFLDRLAEEVGDLLWYVANVATKFDLDLELVARRNLAKTQDRWGDAPHRTPFDAAYPDTERLPRQFSVEFETYRGRGGDAKVRVTCAGVQFGNELTDNAHSSDGYGYHDIIHLAFAAVLGWSPLVRRLLHVKRRSNPKVDQVEDGGRAIAVEEGIAAMVFAYARDYEFLDGKGSVSSDLLRMIRNMVEHLEVSVCTSREWESAIIRGFNVWRELRATGRGVVDLNLDAKQISLRLA